CGLDDERVPLPMAAGEAGLRMRKVRAGLGTAVHEDDADHVEVFELDDDELGPLKDLDGERTLHGVDDRRRAASIADRHVVARVPLLCGFEGLRLELQTAVDAGGKLSRSRVVEDDGVRRKRGDHRLVDGNLYREIPVARQVRMLGWRRLGGARGSGQGADHHNYKGARGSCDTPPRRPAV